MLEHSPQLNITQSELAPRVADYFDNLLAQRDAILATYDLTPETAGQFCELHSSDEDRETMLNLYEKIVYVIEHKEMPQSEVLAKERIQEQQRINDFFGKDANIEVPPLPPTITPERIEQWKQKRFELRYLPPLTLEEDDVYPGWKKQPIEDMNLFRILDHVQYSSLDEQCIIITPNQLPGCWVLIDTRKKPNYETDGAQLYDDDDEIQTIIEKLADVGIVNREAAIGRRNNIDPAVFDKIDFWEPFYEHLGISKEEAIIRLPRIIEQSIFGQEEDWIGTTTGEWADEYYEDGRRMNSGRGDNGGMSCQYLFDHCYEDIGFRPIVIFSSF